MAKKAKAKKQSAKSSQRNAKKETPKQGFFARWRRRVRRTLFAIVALWLIWIAAYGMFPVPTTPYMMAESVRHGDVDYQWVPMDDIAPVMARSAVAAEDANYCLHWGFDITAIRHAIESGARRGASTLSQQVVKNAFLWHGRSWPRKALEALTTPVVELMWSKRRILEVYLNIAEFDTGVFGVEAAARHYYGVGPEALTPTQAARLAAILPSPKSRDAANPGQFTRRRAAQIIDGAATISADGRASCFED
ncbi:monofunctional biosynthetic peptidoglycan transglycosylase [Celeribacter sp.]|uniref:monofunctional biosynthetic peptidoglycan transglycosylase n=1 Tax=Celeribacter sp. TaxID=1890673 RepID=UPI003A92A825